MKRITVLLVFFVFLGVQVFAQSTVTGTVTDASDGQPIPGVTVSVKGFSNAGTLTDIDGKYSIKVPEGGTNLVYSFVGMKAQSKAIGGQAVINVQMQSDDIGLDEVIVVAYGTTKKSSFTGSVGIVKDDAIEKVTSASFVNSLQGTVSGLQVQNSSGQPGAQAVVRIRGVGSLDASSAPLYVIDGVPVSATNYSEIADDGYGTSSSILSTLNPADIESVSVLKDASASSLYGSRAANGVILITTKSGKAGKTSFNVNIKHGITDIAVEMPPVLNAEEYFKVFWDDYYNRGVSSGLTGQSLADYANSSTIAGFGINPYNTVSPYDGSGNLTSGTELYWDQDWRDAVIQKGTIEDYQLSVTGGSEKTTYYISGGYNSNTGNVAGSSFDRYSVKLNSKSKVKDYLTVNVNSLFSFSDQETAPGAGGGASPMSFTNNVANIYPLYEHDANGNVLLESDGSEIYNYYNATQFDFNPVALAELDIYNTETYRALTSVAMGVTFLKDFVFTSTPSIDYISLFETRYYNPEHGNGASVGGRSSKYFIRDMRFNLSNTLKYNKTLGNHSFNVLAGEEVAMYKYDYLNASGTNFPFAGNDHLRAAGTPSGIDSYNTQKNISSFFSNVGYDLSNKYYISASLRSDGSSVFGSEYKWGTFWSVGGSWRITEEDFMSNVSWLDNLKLRASYGTSGNDNIGLYEHLGLFSLGYPYGGDPGLRYTQLANPKLQWETNQIFDVGLEFSFFNKVSGEIDYFSRNGEDLLSDKPLSFTTGFENMKANIASVKNTGFEFQFHSENLRTSNFSWTSDFNITHYKNEITKLSQEEIISGSKRWVVGQDRYQFYIQEWAGVDPSTGEPMWYMDILDANEEPTGERTVTKDYNDASKYELGSALPLFTGGFQNTINYSGFEFSFNLYFSYGAKMLDYTQMSMLHAGSAPGKQLSADILDAWKQPGDITDIPRFYAGNVDNGDQRSSRYIHENSYIRVRNITFAYNLPSTVLERLNMASLRTYVSLENFFTFASYKGSDPELGLDGTTNNYYPHTKTIMFGLNFNF